MQVEQAQQIRACAELTVGDEIEAWHNGKLFHRGRVTQTVSSMDLFWIVDSRTGARRLIDIEALVILRAPGVQTPGPEAPGPQSPGSAAAPARAAGPAPAAAPAAGPAAAGKPAGGRARELVPAGPGGVLFHAPDLRDWGRSGAGW